MPPKGYKKKQDSVSTDQWIKPDTAKVQPKPSELRATDNLPYADEKGIKINYWYKPDGTVEIIPYHQ